MAENPQFSSMSRLWRIILSFLLSAMFLGGGIRIYFVLAGLKQEPPRRDEPARVYSVEAFRVERSDLWEVIPGFGTTRPNREVTLTAQVSGEIVQVFGPKREGVQAKGLKIGQRVDGPQLRSPDSVVSERFPGDLLLRIDPSTYQERIDQAQKKIDEDTVELRRLTQEQKNNDRLLKKVTADYGVYKKQYDRVKRLHEKGAATDAELISSELELGRYEDAKIQHENEQRLAPIRIEQVEKRKLTHRTDLQLANLDMARTEVRPPFSGVISEVMAQQGQFLLVGDPLLRLTDITDVEIPLPLALHDYAKIERLLLAGGMPRVELAEHETAPTRWIGYVVRRSPEADEATRTVEVFVHVDNRDEDNKDQPITLLPSVFVHARIDGPVLEQVMVIPRDAIRDGKVYVASNLKPLSAKQEKPGSSSPLWQAGRSKASSDDVLEGVARQRTVTVQRTLRTLAIISAGLKPGDHIVMTNLDVIHDGAKVRIQSRYGLRETLQKQGTQVLRPHVLAGGSSDDRDNLPMTE